MDSAPYDPFELPKPQGRKLVTVRRIARMEQVPEDPDYVEVNFEGCGWPVLIPKGREEFKACYPY